MENWRVVGPGASNPRTFHTREEAERRAKAIGGGRVVRDNSAIANAAAEVQSILDKDKAFQKTLSAPDSEATRREQFVALERAIDGWHSSGKATDDERGDLHWHNAKGDTITDEEEADDKDAPACYSDHVGDDPDFVDRLVTYFEESPPKPSAGGVAEKYRSQARALASSRPKRKPKSGTRRKNDLKSSPGSKPGGMRVITR